MIRKTLLFTIFSASALVLSAQTSPKLTGTVISNPENAERPASNAFDGDVTTSYKSSAPSHAWVGYDLGTKYVINKVRWYNAEGVAKVNAEGGWDGTRFYFDLPHSCTAVFEGANLPDFSDAVPLYLITDPSTTSDWHEADINVTRGFRYVRYMGANTSQGRVCEVEFYGTAGDGDDTQFYQPTNLPIVVVHTKQTTKTQSNGQTVTFPAGSDPWDSHDAFPDDEEREATFTFISQDGAKIMTQDGYFRERGNSSRHYAKRPYRIKLNEKQKIFSADAKAKKWTLVPAIDDKTLMRNIIGYGIYEKLNPEYTPYVRPVDVFVNGEFKGQYQFCDQVEAGKNRVDIEEIKPLTKDEAGNPTSWPSNALTDFGWFFEIDAQMLVDNVTKNEAPGSWFVTSSPRIPVAIKSPDDDENVAAYTSTIKSHFQKMLNAAANGTVDQYLDLPSFARYFLGIEFVVNTDGYRSIFMHKHAGDDKIFSGPIWDLNLTLNNDYRIGDVNECTEWSYKEPLKRGEEHWANAGDVATVIGNIVEKNPLVLKEIKDVWASVRQNGAFETQSLLAEVNALKTKLQTSADLNYMRWPILGAQYFYLPATPGTWDAEIERMSTALAGRVEWMDNKLAMKRVTEDISITDAGWATIYLPLAFDVPGSLECFAITGIEEGKLVLEPVQSTEANTPYLLKGAPGTYTVSGYAGGYAIVNNDKVTGSDATRGERTLGLLTGVAKERAATVGSYILQNHNGRVCFYKVYEDSGSQFLVDRAYLTILKEAASNAPVRFYLDEEEAGLDELAIQTSGMARIYDLTGKLLLEVEKANRAEQEALRHLGQGIYIIRVGNDSRKVVLN